MFLTGSHFINPAVAGPGKVEWGVLVLVACRSDFVSMTQPLPLQKAICKLLIPLAPTQQLSGPHDAPPALVLWSRLSIGRTLLSRDRRKRRARYACPYRRGTC